KVVATFRAKTLAEISRDALSRTQPLVAMIKPTLAPAVARPFGGRPFHRFDTLQVLGVDFQPLHQCRPQAQQALLSYSETIHVRSPISYKQPRGYKPLHHAKGVARNFINACHSPHRAASHSIDPRQEWNECFAQESELYLLIDRDRG